MTVPTTPRRGLVPGRRYRNVTCMVVLPDGATVDSITGGSVHGARVEVVQFGDANTGHPDAGDLTGLTDPRLTRGLTGYSTAEIATLRELSDATGATRTGVDTDSSGVRQGDLLFVSADVTVPEGSTSAGPPRSLFVSTARPVDPGFAATLDTWPVGQQLATVYMTREDDLERTTALDRVASATRDAAQVAAMSSSSSRATVADAMSRSVVGVYRDMPGVRQPSHPAHAEMARLDDLSTVVLGTSTDDAYLDGKLDRVCRDLLDQLASDPSAVDRIEELDRRAGDLLAERDMVAAIGAEKTVRTWDHGSKAGLHRTTGPVSERHDVMQARRAGEDQVRMARVLDEPSPGSTGARYRRRLADQARDDCVVFLAAASADPELAETGPASLAVRLAAAQRAGDALTVDELTERLDAKMSAVGTARQTLDEMLPGSPALQTALARDVDGVQAGAAAGVRGLATGSGPADPVAGRGMFPGAREWDQAVGGVTGGSRVSGETDGPSL